MDRQKKYNTIDTNVQPQGGNSSVGGGASLMGGPTGTTNQPMNDHHRGTHATQETAGTSNPSNDVN